jgi:FkbM family methyltransferase
MVKRSGGCVCSGASVATANAIGVAVAPKAVGQQEVRGVKLSHYAKQLQMRGDVLGHLPVYSMRMLEYLWIAAVPKKNILKLRFGPARFSMHFSPMGQGNGSRGMFLFREDYEPLLKHGHKFLSPGAVAFDVGANQGLFTAAFGSVASTVVAVEPIPWQAERVRANIKLNGHTQAHVVEAAISDTVGEAALDLSSGDTAASIARSNKARKSIKVATTTLDQLADRFGLKRVDIVKLDVEGAELMALDGGRNMIQTFKPVLCLEASNDQLFARIQARLKDAGYRMFRFDRKGLLRPVAEVSGWVDNVFFLTPDHEARYSSFIAA